MTSGMRTARPGSRLAGRPGVRAVGHESLAFNAETASGEAAAPQYALAAYHRAVRDAILRSGAR